MTTRLQTARRLALLAGAATLTLLTACDPDKDPEIVNSTPSDRVYVVNEGLFGTPNGEVSLYSPATKAVTARQLFQAANGSLLGDNVQSMTVIGERAYLAVTASNRLEIVGLSDFKRVKGLALTQPRYVAAVGGGKAYVTQWTSFTAPGQIAVLNLTTNEVVKTIRTGVGVLPEQVLLGRDGRVYVANSGSDFISVIDPATDVVLAPIATPGGPKSLVQDAAGNIWALCSLYGAPQDFLIRFAPGAPTQQTRIAFANDYRNGNLRLNGPADRVYVSLGTGTYELPLTATTLPAQPLIRRTFYGLGIDPRDNTIYGGAGLATADGYVARYSATGAKLDSFQVGVLPNGFYFQ